MRERKKEHDRCIRFARTQTSAVSEHANEKGRIPIWSKVKFIDRDPPWNRSRVKEAIHISLHPNYINRDSGSTLPKLGYPRSNKTTTDLRGPVREQHLTTGIIIRIEIHQ